MLQETLIKWSIHNNYSLSLTHCYILIRPFSIFILKRLYSFKTCGGKKIFLLLLKKYLYILYRVVSYPLIAEWGALLTWKLRTCLMCLHNYSVENKYLILISTEFKPYHQSVTLIPNLITNSRYQTWHSCYFRWTRDKRNLAFPYIFII